MTRIDGNATLPQTNDSVIQSVDQLAIQLGGDPQAYLAAMVLKFAGERRDDGQRMRSNTENLIQRMEHRQVQEMREQADKIRMAGVFAGAGGILGGAATMVAGNAMGDAADAAKGGNDALAETHRATAKLFEGGGAVTKAVGDGGSGVFGGYAKDDEASSIAAANRANANIRRLDSIEDDLDSANDMENRALDFLEQINKTTAETEQSLYIRG